MTLLLKYYEYGGYEGGGIPDEVRIEKAYQLLVKKSKEAYLSSGSFSASPFGLDGIPHVRRDAISKLMVEFSDSELSLASEELARLKEDINRFMGDGESNYISTDELNAEFNKKGIELICDGDGSDADNIASAVKGLLNKLEDSIEELKEENERLRGEVEGRG